MNKIKINECVYNIHPVYDLYAADENGNIIHIVKKVPMKGAKQYSGYMRFSVRKYAQSSKKTFQVHRFIWECFNGAIPDGKVIDHINDIKDDNRLNNLQLVTQQENCKKSAKDRDFSSLAKNHVNKKCVKAINIETNEVNYFDSIYATQQYLGINCGLISMCCQGINNIKSATSKKDYQRYRFEYVKKEDMPDDYFKSANKRPKRQREYICQKCNEIMKNHNKSNHNKICEITEKLL